MGDTIQALAGGDQSHRASGRLGDLYFVFKIFISCGWGVGFRASALNTRWIFPCPSRFWCCCVSHHTHSASQLDRTFTSGNIRRREGDTGQPIRLIGAPTRKHFIAQSKSRDCLIQELRGTSFLNLEGGESEIVVKIN